MNMDTDIQQKMSACGKEIAVLVSGGVDSSVVVHLLCEQGWHPSLFYIKIGMEGADFMDCPMEEDMEMVNWIAHHYGLPLEVVDLHRDYWDSVAAYALDKIRQGLTPNPDVMCNRLIKFGCFEQRLGRHFPLTATGHYATTYQQQGLTWLGTAVDPVKDQTDFLAQIDYLQLNKLYFPLGPLPKREVRRIAAEAGLPSARRRDSQGICFLGDIPYNDFVRRFLGERPGPIVEWESGRVLGTHKGYWFHTIGQRKGLGLSGGPWFVVKKSVEENIVYVSHGATPLQYGTEFRMNQLHFITANPWADELNIPHPVSFKIRHTPEFIRGMLTFEPAETLSPQLHGADGSTPPKGSSSSGSWVLRSEELLQGIAPGQFGVIYDEAHRLCYGSGEITL